ncbi:MAG: YqaJ viral recombinase family protein [Oscillospiraceae bacterium]|nr:YqaJ viral recombinase family protein [Oscillospiraceae bacterium]MBQ6465863.1 YqaJ viral recombinase family protein [Oscillospiraceae bacterium]
MFFECNLPRSLIPVYQPWLYQALESTIRTVYQRTKKLNAALDYLNRCGCPMQPETFQLWASSVFKLNPGRFDALSHAELATLCMSLYDGEEQPKRLEFPNAIVLYDTAFVTTKDWEILRHIGLGGSDSSVTNGASEFQTEEGLFYEKLGYTDLLAAAGKRLSDDKGGAVFERGHNVEDKVISIFCEMTGAVRIRETRMFQSKRYPACTANVDAILRMPDGETVPFEAKSTIDQYTTKQKWFGDAVPMYYLTQVHQYLGVLDDPRIKRAFIGCLPVNDVILADKYIASEPAYFNGERQYFHQEIKRDLEMETAVMTNAQNFWDRYIAMNLKPNPSGKADMDHYVALHFRPSPLTDDAAADLETPINIAYGDVEDDYAQFKKLDAEISSLQERIKTLDEGRKVLKDKLANLMGDSVAATVIDHDGNPIFYMTNKPGAKITYDREILEKYFPEAEEKARRVSSYLTLRVTEKAPKKKKTK